MKKPILSESQRAQVLGDSTHQTAGPAKKTEPIEIRIFKRYKTLFRSTGTQIASQLDISLTLHYSGQCVPLDLERLLAFDEFNFLHDVCGMLHHMDRRTCELDPAFLPRCARQAALAAG